MGNYDVILSFTKNTATAGSCDTLPAVAVFVLCMLPIIPEGKENQGNYQNAIGDRSSNQHPYKEKFSRQTKTENTAHHGQALSVYLPTNWNHRRICTKKQTTFYDLCFIKCGLTVSCVLFILSVIMMYPCTRRSVTISAATDNIRHSFTPNS